MRSQTVRRPWAFHDRPFCFIGVVRLLAWISVAHCLVVTTLAEDEVELLSGIRVQGKIIERTEQSIKIQVTVESRQLIRSYPLNRVRAVIREGQRQVLTPQTADLSKTGPGVNSEGALSPSLSAGSEILQRTAAAVESLIQKMGRTAPDWFDATPLEYPETLNLTWPEPTPIIWNYTRNVDHYIWDIINTNPKRYPSGVRLMHHMLQVNQTSEGTRARVMDQLGRMYFEFFRDYARAAFWWRQANVEKSPKFSQSPSPAHLAECYWRLGSRSMAMDLLNHVRLTPAVVKAWGDLKEKEKALRLCDEGLRNGFLPSQTYLLAGDVCRTVRDFSQAAEFYRKVLEVSVEGTPARVEQIRRDQDRSRATLEVIRLFDTLDVSRIADGPYAGKSLGYSGNVEVEAVVKAGRIESLNVAHHSDRQYYHAIEETTRRILARQTVSGVDAISGATITSEAVIRASAKALAEGMSTNAAQK
ncbi:MAG: FMN-binding protein [Pedosphaera sp.]|nr:FMN-binding protein [Pedosphaera sp.]